MKEEMVMFVTTEGETVQVHASAIYSISRNGDRAATVTCHEDKYMVHDLVAEKLIEELFTK